MSDALRNLLELNLPKTSGKNSKVVLGVADKKLAAEISSTFSGVQCESAENNPVVAALLRGIRVHAAYLMRLGGRGREWRREVTNSMGGSKGRRIAAQFQAAAHPVNSRRPCRPAGAGASAARGPIPSWRKPSARVRGSRRSRRPWPSAEEPSEMGVALKMTTPSRFCKSRVLPDRSRGWRFPTGAS